MSSSTRPVLDSSELITVASVYAMCCNEASNVFTEGKRKKVSPLNMVKERDALEDCAAKTYTGVQTHCGDAFGALKTCLADNPKSWVECKELRAALDMCAVKNRLGELEGK
eukprot:CAMPEP_0183295912 /NCGR_PEP_ID=MMETSP0160_2-20130417/3682_1 /TAXON_ID=2839 ORGANISM="Odontella Sinensis, Strain Grunow 1884" /NCGR_SAMPLE_ID=MMETSP0160_2 /ASSEMBLY_ACC=CAM_ASM_000250 /LENGTH=110 /DNA_ID=CAMNT_0025457453 /DNA_START=72 /DNA_END=404 /DNA_ORIENTATION=-